MTYTGQTHNLRKTLHLIKSKPDELYEISAFEKVACYLLPTYSFLQLYAAQYIFYKRKITLGILWNWCWEGKEEVLRLVLHKETERKSNVKRDQDKYIKRKAYKLRSNWASSGELNLVDSITQNVFMAEGRMFNICVMNFWNSASLKQACSRNYRAVFSAVQALHSTAAFPPELPQNSASVFWIAIELSLLLITVFATLSGTGMPYQYNAKSSPKWDPVCPTSIMLNHLNWPQYALQMQC
jgi:hypothetical protein